MESLTDYVKWMANKIGADLDDEVIIDITLKMANCEKYNEHLKELQQMIFIADNEYFT